MTVTLNPAVDKTLWVPGFESGKTLIVERSHAFSGGKGVNVSRALKNLGIDSTATGVLARDGSESYLKLIDREGLRHDFLFVEGTLRTNVTILSENQESETHLREKGPVLGEAVFQEFENKLRGLLHTSTLVVLSGGLPPGLGPEAYLLLIDIVHTCGARAALDASGGPLRLGLRARPYLIKPNAHEVEESLGFFPRTKEDILRAVSYYQRDGVEVVMISLGKEGLVFSRGGHTFHARLSIAKPVNSVGSGDAAFAGGIAGILSGLSEDDSARLACAVGGANTLVSGACIFRLEDVDRLLAEVEIKKIV